MGGSRLVVRTAGPQDAGAVLALVADVRAGAAGAAGSARDGSAPVAGDAGPGAGGSSGDPADGRLPEAVVASALSRHDVLVLLAELRERAVGVLVLRRGEVLPLSERSAAHVEQLAVAPDQRRRGVGRALLAAAARSAHDDGLARIVVSAPPSGREAQRFLARLGFSPLVVQRSASVAALREALRGPRPTAPPPVLDERLDAAASRRAAVERVLSRRRRERGLTGTL
ncbi:GNAT family N-acetyltransferase [Pseudokineococcus basanitobsidens]|uniref:GNAT family N-acetyltransferase n=1 Tax=Pseudokineococcus basanitobsidens TaxID=1926649 RepID=A0ABU8RI74_9ACTN